MKNFLGKASDIGKSFTGLTVRVQKMHLTVNSGSQSSKPNTRLNISAFFIVIQESTNTQLSYKEKRFESVI